MVTRHPDEPLSLIDRLEEIIAKGSIPAYTLLPSLARMVNPGCPPS
jgi:hypothetical protein